MLAASLKMMLRHQNNKLINKIRFPISSGFCTDKVDSSKTHRPTTFEKYLLVFMKKYPSLEEVPKHVSPGTMTKVYNWARIKLSITICLLAGVIYVFMAFSGKAARKRGESVKQMNIDWHKEQDAKAE